MLREAEPLLSRGLQDVLIGSYVRETGIWPGKDVDVFGRLCDESIDSITPSDAYGLFFRVLKREFDDRVEPQARSIKVNYSTGRQPDRRFIVAAAEQLASSSELTSRDAYPFAVDVVPAVRFGPRWGIPNRDPSTWVREAAAERWLCTDPEHLTLLTQQLNQRLAIGGQGAYVPTVKSIRQIRRAHLQDAKPGGLFMELILYEGFTLNEIAGDTWADLTASALTYIADRLLTVTTTPLCDPALNQPYTPVPDTADLVHAATVFRTLASKASRALTADKCPAGALWREIFGSNTKVNGPVFEPPPGCTASGTVMPVFGTQVRDPLRGTNEARGFGVE
ncbi:MAG TPA: hypothetical protein VJM33_04025 [Microthrixaceae bacterium]|nr:hypothetical protein [Microthrixaceae bacterium]